VKPHPLVILGIGVLFSSLSSILIRLADSPAFVIAAYRLIFSTLFVLPLIARDAMKRARADGEAAATSAELRRDVALAVLSGVFLAAHFATWISSLGYTTVASATVLVTTHPIIVAAASAVVLSDRLHRRSLGFMAVALGGSVLLAFAGTGGPGDAESTRLLGNLLALAGAVAVSGYIIIGRILRQRMGLNRYTLIVYGTAAVLLVGLALVTGRPLWGYPLREFVIFALLALLCTNLGHSLMSWALKYVRPTVVSVSILGEPVIATTLALILFAEVPGPLTLVGAAVVLGSITLFVRSESHR
jgi:drug/metabolite transporter (DMT)-like permease